MGEISMLAGLGLVAACIWSAWGPKVLLAVIVIPPVLFFGVVFVEEQRSNARYEAKRAAAHAKYERCKAALEKKATNDFDRYGCNPFDTYTSGLGAD